jgi:transposase-like protein
MKRRKDDLETKMMRVLAGLRGETLTFYQLPLQHHKHLKSTNMLERFNKEIKGRPLMLDETEGTPGAFQPRRQLVGRKPRTKRPRQFCGIDMSKFIIPGLGWAYLWQAKATQAH